jgi:hypothetical protein
MKLVEKAILRVLVQSADATKTVKVTQNMWFNHLKKKNNLVFLCNIGMENLY